MTPTLELALLQRGIDAYRNHQMFDFRMDRLWQKGWLAAMEADVTPLSLTLDRPAPNTTKPR